MYIKNCVSYGLDPLQELTCKKCAENYVLSTHHSKKCFVNTKIQNCEVAFNEEVCFKCSDGFVLVDS